MRWILLLLLLPFVLAESPEDIKLTGFVNDYAGVLSAEDEAIMSRFLESIFNSGKAEFTVVTVTSLDGIDSESFALQIAQGQLGFAEKNNGLLLLIVIEDRQYRFEVGRGLEPIFNDAKVGRIGRDIIVPAFQKLDYAAGIGGAIVEVATELEVDLNSNVPVAQRRGNSDLYRLLFYIGFMLIIFISSYRARKSGRRGSNFFLAAMVASTMMRGGRGGLGGGFGGFGGGGFGGGGAGGGW